MENIGSFLVLLAIIVMLAFLCESFTEYLFGVLFDRIEKLKAYKWTLIYLSAVFGVLLTTYFRLDLVALLASAIAYLAGVTYSWPVTTAGMILSGLVIGRGSGFLHDFLTNFLKKPTFEDYLLKE